MSDFPSWVLHLDVDAFFASLEQRDNPSLRGRPVAVGTGVVASCSYESRPYGVRTAMRIVDARRLCPSLVVLPGDYRRYEIAGRQILGICHEHTALVELAALDDLYLALGRIPQRQAEEIAQRISATVTREVGIRVSLGLATNKLLSAVATQEVKDRKARGERSSDLAVVVPGQEQAYLAPRPADILPGVGPKAMGQLAQLHVRTVAQLAEVPVSVLVGLFGNFGKTLRDLARGIDHRDVQVYRPAQSLSRCTSFDPPVGEIPVLEAMIDHLIERAALWLRLHNQMTKGVMVRIRYADHFWADNRVSLPDPSDEEDVLRRTARERLRRVYTRRLPLRLIGIELSPLTGRRHQGELFVDPQREKMQRLRACKDEIRQRFGFMAVNTGTVLELNDHLEHDRDNFRLRTPCLTR